MKRANSGLTWIRQEHVQTVLRQLASAEVVSHEQIDKLPATKTRDYVRGLLVEHGALPQRDEYMFQFQNWSLEAMKRVESAEHIEVVKRYLTWHQQRRLLDGGTVTIGRFLRAKQDTTVAIQFLNWLHDRQYPLAELNQAQFEEWKIGGTSTRLIAVRFLRWAMSSRLTPKWEEPTPKSSRAAATLDTRRQDVLVERITRSDTVDVRDRAIAILVLIFAQPIGKVLALTREELKITRKSVSIRLGKFDVVLPPPLDEPFRELVANPPNHQTAAHPNSKWLFPGQKPGTHLSPSFVANRIKSLLPARASRLGSLQALSMLAPAPVIAEALGYSPKTIESARAASGETYARYIEAIRDSSS